MHLRPLACLGAVLICLSTSCYRKVATVTSTKPGPHSNAEYIHPAWGHKRTTFNQAARATPYVVGVGAGAALAITSVQKEDKDDRTQGVVAGVLVALLGIKGGAALNQMIRDPKPDPVPVNELEKWLAKHNARREDKLVRIPTKAALPMLVVPESSLADYHEQERAADTFFDDALAWSTADLSVDQMKVLFRTRPEWSPLPFSTSFLEYGSLRYTVLKGGYATHDPRKSPFLTGDTTLVVQFYADDRATEPLGIYWGGCTNGRADGFGTLLLKENISGRFSQRRGFWREGRFAQEQAALDIALNYLGRFDPIVAFNLPYSLPANTTVEITKAYYTADPVNPLLPNAYSLHALVYWTNEQGLYWYIVDISAPDFGAEPTVSFFSAQESLYSRYEGYQMVTMWNGVMATAIQNFADNLEQGGRIVDLDGLTMIRKRQHFYPDNCEEAWGWGSIDVDVLARANRESPWQDLGTWTMERSNCNYYTNTKYGNGPEGGKGLLESFLQGALRPTFMSEGAAIDDIVSEARIHAPSVQPTRDEVLQAAKEERMRKEKARQIVQRSATSPKLQYTAEDPLRGLWHAAHEEALYFVFSTPEKLVYRMHLRDERLSAPEGYGAAILKQDLVKFDRTGYTGKPGSSMYGSTITQLERDTITFDRGEQWVRLSK